MMEQEELLDFKALRAKFQQEDPLKLMIKPAIPQKPKVIPPPPSGTRVNLISSINAAVESKTLFAPRVVFKDDKPKSPQSPTPKDKEPGVKPELIDKKQKREGDAIKQAMKDKNLPLVLPVAAPVAPPAPVPEPATPSHPTKPAPPKKKGLSFFKKPSKAPKVKAEGGESVSPPNPPGPPSPPSNGAALTVDTPVAQKPLLPPIPVTSPTVDSPVTVATAPVAQKPLPLPPPIPVTSPTLDSPVTVATAPVAQTPLPPPIPVTSPTLDSSITVATAPVAQKPLPPPIPVTSPTLDSSVTVATAPVAQKPLPPPIPVTSPTLDSSGAEVTDPVAQKPPISPVPVIPTPTSIPAPVIADAAVVAPDDPSLEVTVSKNSIPIPEPEVSAPEEAALPDPDSEVPSIETSALSTPDLETTTEVIPEPDMSSDVSINAALELPEVPELEVSVTDIPAPEMSFSEEPDSEINELEMPVPVIPPPDIPYSDAPDPQISDLNIPDPVTEDADITAPSISDVISLDEPDPIITSASIPAADNLTVSRTPSPKQIAPHEVASTPLPPELPPAPVEFAEVEHVATETNANTEETIEGSQSPVPPKPILALSALERAEENSPGKKTPPGDQRILNLLEKAKRKYAAHQAAKAQSPSPSPSESPIPPLSVTPTPADHTLSVSPTALLPELPPVDYEDSAEQNETVQGQPMTLVNGFDHRQVSPILEEPGMEEAEIPPPTPAKKPLPSVPSLGHSPDKPSQAPVVDLGPYQLVSQIPEPQEEVVNVAPLDLSPEEPAQDPQSLSLEVSESDDVPDVGAPEVEIPECGVSDSSTLEEAAATVEPDVSVEDLDEEYVETDLGPPVDKLLEAPAATTLADPPSSPVSQDVQTPAGAQEGIPETTDDVYEDVTTNKKKSKKRKSPPKNPYADSQPPPEETQKSGWFKAKKSSAEIAEEKEQKKKEKQREKEREKERERQKKEQKERQKKENEMKKKFKITGQEKPMYEAKVCVANKGKNNELPVKIGDMVSIISTTNCPKGKWLARDSSNKYGYIPVESLELDITEMMEMGKRVKATSHVEISQVDGDTQNVDSGMSNHYELGSESFEDDDEWDDEQEPLSPTELTHTTDNGQYSTLSELPETVSPEPESEDLSPTDDSAVDPVYMQARHEALQKLSTFFKPAPGPGDATPENNSAPAKEPSTESQLTSCLTKKVNPEVPGMSILPPPDLYADVVTEESLYTYSN